MREIKFRAWDRELKQFVYYKLVKGIVEWLSGNPDSFDKDRNNNQQFTGLLDKQGKEIYEGDIVKGDWSIVNDIESGVVEFYGGAFRYKPAGLPLEFGYYRKECEIIGNIYENPELIK